MWQWPVYRSCPCWMRLPLGLRGPGKAGGLFLGKQQLRDVVRWPFSQSHLWAFLRQMSKVKLFKFTHFDLTGFPRDDSFSFQFSFQFGSLSYCLPGTSTGRPLLRSSCLVLPVSDILHWNVCLVCKTSCVLKHSGVQLPFGSSCRLGLILSRLFACSALAK